MNARKSDSHLKIVRGVPEKPPLVLTREHIDVLRYLRDMGFERAALFDEDTVDELFRARPRLIELVRGHAQATIDITSEGLRRLAEVSLS